MSQIPTHRIAVNLDLHASQGSFPFRASGELVVDGYKVEHVSSLDMQMAASGSQVLVVRFAEHLTAEEAREASPALRNAIVTSIRGLRCFPFVRVESPFLNA